MERVGVIGGGGGTKQKRGSPSPLCFLSSSRASFPPLVNSPFKKDSLFPSNFRSVFLG
jgi:hypothetical protein